MAVLLGIELLAGCGLISGENISSSLLGNVVDSTGAPVPAAQITVTNSGTGTSVNAVTDWKGTYLVPQVVGRYVRCCYPELRFSDLPRHYSAPLLGGGQAGGCRAQPGTVKQTVTVTDVGSMVSTDSMTIANSVSTRQLADLPTAHQTVDAFIGLAPGVQSYGDATNPAIGGGTHWGSVNLTLNGVGVNDPGNSGAVTVQGTGLLVLPPPRSIQELKVQGNGMSAKYRAHSEVALGTPA
jgi:hypothetical protein